ncbi:MAG: WG repeat-containing protein [Cytophagales bacterium]|nr:WG repeat-containing protein [Cytophagales bacterium]
MNQEGDIVIPVEYDDAFWFHNGIAKIRKGEKGFYMDKNGKWVKDEKKRKKDEYR